jgi:hypothetical protein
VIAFHTHTLKLGWLKQDARNIENPRISFSQANSLTQHCCGKGYDCSPHQSFIHEFQHYFC